MRHSPITWGYNPLDGERLWIDFSKSDVLYGKLVFPIKIEYIEVQKELVLTTHNKVFRIFVNILSPEDKAIFTEICWVMDVTRTNGFKWTK